MTVSSDSDQHRAVSKNGKERIQDRDIETLFIKMEKNDTDHDVITKLLSEVLGDRKWFKWAAGVVVTLVLAGFGFLGWTAVEISSHNASQAASAERDRDMKGDIGKVEQDLRVLRGLVTQHQINKGEHNSHKE